MIFSCVLLVGSFFHDHVLQARANAVQARVDVRVSALKARVKALGKK